MRAILGQMSVASPAAGDPRGPAGDLLLAPACRYTVMFEPAIACGSGN